MESCIKPFLENCDIDSDGGITLIEWGECLGVAQGAFASGERPKIDVGSASVGRVIGIGQYSPDSVRMSSQMRCHSATI